MRLSVPPAAGALTGTALNSTVVDSSLVSFGALAAPVTIVPLLVNSWADQGVVTPSYWKDHNGVVQLRGNIGGGASGSTAFTLPVGFRPTATHDFPSFDSVTLLVAWIRIDAAGVVTITGSPNNVRLTAIRFRTDS